jgi:hypothetical protein
MSWQLTDPNESGCGSIAPRVIWARSRPGLVRRETLGYETASQAPRQEEALWRSSTNAALDVHQATVVARVRRPGEWRPRPSEVRTFGTTTGELAHRRRFLRNV